ncbi:unnamed protein product [Ectocarpus sp. 8 AP-2014]
MTDNATTGDQDDSSSPKARFYTPDDVALHNCAEDCWLSLFGQVLDLTELILANRGPLADPLIAAAGTDVSHWFHLPPPPDVKKPKPRGIGGSDKSNNKALSTKIVKEGGDGNGRLEECENASEPRTFVDPQTGLTTPYLPMGRFLHVPPNFPTTKWSTSFGLPWWRDRKRVVGKKLTRKARPLRVVNILSRQEDQLLVACEDTIADIQERYLEYNAHAASYTWKVLQDEKFVPAKMDQTLEENGIVDDDLAFEKLGIDDDGYMPVLHIYFNDDLTIA